MIINSDKKVAELARFLLSKRRNIPVVVVSTNIEHTGPVINVPQLQGHVGEKARVFYITGGYLKLFNTMMENIFGIVPTGVRIYYTNMQRNDPPSRHHVWNENMIAGFGSTLSFLDMIDSKVTPRHALVTKPKISAALQAEALFNKSVKQPAKKISEHVARHPVLSLKITPSPESEVPPNHSPFRSPRRYPR